MQTVFDASHFLCENRNYFIAYGYLCCTTEIINANLNGRKFSSFSAPLSSTAIAAKSARAVSASCT